jgi:hypothetical protein
MRVTAAAVAILAGCALAGCASSAQSTSAGSGSSPSAGESTGNTSPGMGGTASITPPSTSSSAAAAAVALAACPSKVDSANSSDPKAKVVPTGIKVEWVLRCSIVSEGGVPQQVLAERSVTSPDALVLALQTPSAQRAKIVCPMFAVYLPHFALVESDGTVFVPKVPLNNCGKPQSTVVQALNSMKFDKLATRSLK